MATKIGATTFQPPTDYAVARITQDDLLITERESCIEELNGKGRI